MHLLKLIFFLLIALFFLIFGISVLISAYRLNDPFTFILTFFAANLIILISTAIALGFVLQLLRLNHPQSKDKPHHLPPQSPE